MPIPTLKIKTARRTEENDLASPKSTMLPRASRLHAGAGSGPPAPHTTSQIPSPYQGQREGKLVRQGISTSKIGSRMSTSGASGPRPPPRTTSSLKSFQSPKSPNAAKGTASPPVRAQVPSKPVAAARHSYLPGRVSIAQMQQANACGSNRNSVISTCSSNPPPSSSSSNRNSNSSIGSTFSVGSWNGNSETNEAPVLDGRVNSGTFPRVKSMAKSQIMEGNNPRTADRSRMRIPNSYTQKSINLQLKNRLVGNALSTSDSSITGRPRVVFKSNFSSPNLTESNSMKSFNSRFRSQPEKARFAVPNPIVDSDSSDSDGSKNRDFKHLKMARDMKYRKDNVAMVAPLKKPARGVENDSRAELSKRLQKTSAEDDDGYSSVAITDQTEEDEQDRKKMTVFDEAVSIKPMKPLKLLDSSYSYFARVGNSSLKQVSVCNTTSSIHPSADQDFNCRPEVGAKFSKEGQFFMNDLESNSNGSLTAGTSDVKHYDSATIPKNVKFSSTTDRYPVQTSSKIDDSIYGVSYEKLVNSKTELIKKQAEPRIKPVKKFASVKPSHDTNTESGRLFPHPNYSMEAPSMKGLSQNIPTTGYSPRPNTLAPDFEGDSENKPLFNRTKSLRFPVHKDTKRELLPKIKPDETIELPDDSMLRSASFPGGGNKYSTVIPRTSDGLRCRQNRQMTTFVTPCKTKEPSAVSQHVSEMSHTTENDRSVEVLSLQAELKVAKERVNSLTEQVTSKSKLLSAYEHSLTNMTHRLQHLSSLGEQKDIQINELKRMVEKACLDGVCISSNFNAQRASMNRGPSMESLASITSTGSLVSYCSTASSMFTVDGENKEKKKKNWIRSSFRRAFKRKGKKKYLEYDPSNSDAESYSINARSFSRSISEPFKGFSSLPASPVPQRNVLALSQQMELGDSEMSDSSNLQDEVKLLRKSLRDKESSLTESRLEALSSAHQIEGLKESMQKLSFDLASFKASKTTIHTKEKKHESAGRVKPSISIKYKEVVTKKVFVLLSSSHHCDETVVSQSNRAHQRDTNIGEVIVSNVTTWQELFNLLQKTFLSHVFKIDSENCIGVDLGSIASYRIGDDILIASINETQELLPYGYFVGDVDWVEIKLCDETSNCMDELAYETLIPKQNLLKYVSILQESRRIILGGADGTGKRYLARKLAEVVIRRLGVNPSSINIAKFQAHNHTSQELQSYLCHINDLCQARKSDLPLVIIVESLNSEGDFFDLLSSSLKVSSDQCPYVICTVRVPELQKYELLSSLGNFRWISLVSSQESSQRLIQRICRRAHLACCTVEQESQLVAILEWIPRCFGTINSVLETSSLNHIEPGAFLPLPKCLDAAQAWFSCTWKATVLPKILMAADASSNLQDDLEPWKKLYSCLKEDLPWIVFPNNCDANFPIAFKTIETSC